MVGRRSPRRFNILTKPSTAKALIWSNRKPKFVGFRQNPVSAVHEAPASYYLDDDITPDVQQDSQASDTQPKKTQHLGNERHPIIMNNETTLSTSMASKDSIIRDDSQDSLPNSLLVSMNLPFLRDDATEKTSSPDAVPPSPAPEVFSPCY